MKESSVKKLHPDSGKHHIAPQHQRARFKILGSIVPVLTLFVTAFFAAQYMNIYSQCQLFVSICACLLLATVPLPYYPWVPNRRGLE